ncbi:MAG: glycosyl transferase, partial [Pseudomonadota bacterium]
LIADHKRLVDFEGGKPNPRAFTMADWELLTGSPAFFARKFDETLDPELMRRMAERIGASEPGRP